MPWWLVVLKIVGLLFGGVVALVAVFVAIYVLYFWHQTWPPLKHPRDLTPDWGLGWVHRRRREHYYWRGLYYYSPSGVAVCKIFRHPLAGFPGTWWSVTVKNGQPTGDKVTWFGYDLKGEIKLDVEAYFAAVAQATERKSAA